MRQDTRDTTDENRTDDTSPSAGWKTVYARFDVSTAVHTGEPSALVADGGTPRTRTVARRVGVDPDHLQQFVTFHPDPTVDAVAGAFDLDDADETLVERWLAAHDHGGETA